MSTSEEEEIARNYICFENPDATIVVVDSTSLERNLNLVLQIIEITPNVIVCVNLLDEAKKKGIKIDLNKLQKILNCPVVGTIATQKRTLKKLLKETETICIKNSFKNNNFENCSLEKFSNKNINNLPFKMEYSKEIEDAINLLLPILNKETKIPDYLQRWICIKLLDNDKKILNSIESHFKINFSENTELSKTLDSIFLSFREINFEFKDNLVTSIVNKCAEITREVCTYTKKNYSYKDRQIDKILTSKKWGIPIMLAFLGLIFYLTITFSNYPSDLLFTFFEYIQEKLLYLLNLLHSPEWLTNMLIFGIFKTVTWIIAVMLPPMAIFFPLFTFLEDLGFLPRLCFNVDGFFKKASTSGKQMITMCMGFGCNAAGVVGTRIIDSPREKIIAAITNSFVPCNGRYPFLIAISTIFIAHSLSGVSASILSSLTVILIILLGIFLTIIISKILSKTVLKGLPSSFILELPPYRKPQIGKIVVNSIVDRTIFVLFRAIKVAIPASIVLWLFANISIDGLSLLSIVANLLDPFAQIMGLDGYILTAFIFGMPANEIVLPIILMCYLGNNSLTDISDYKSIREILLNNGWNIITAINVMIFTLLHFPCLTTMLTIKKETGKTKWMLLSALLPTICGIIICTFINLVFSSYFV